MKPCKSSLRWSLLAIAFLLVAAASMCFGLAARQRAAISEIERLGGRVLSTQGGPDWLRTLLGNRAMYLFDRATLVNLSDTAAKDADLVQLTRLRGVERLNLSGTRVTDAGLRRLEQLDGLKALDLTGTQVTDAGLVHLAGLRDLEYLYLDGTPVTDRGLKHLKPLSRLRHLSADDMDVITIERWRSQQPE